MLHAGEILFAMTRSKAKEDVDDWRQNQIAINKTINDEKKHP